MITFKDVNLFGSPRALRAPGISGSDAAPDYPQTQFSGNGGAALPV